MMPSVFRQSLYYGCLIGCSTFAADFLAPRLEYNELLVNLRGPAAGKAVLLETTDLRAWSPAYSFIQQNSEEELALTPLSEVRFFRVAYTNFSVPGGFVWISPGTFAMGSPEDEEGRRIDEGPLRPVKFRRGFWMGRHEVTVREYEQFMRANPSMSPSDSQYPVENVTIEQALEYCWRRTLADRQAGLLPPACHYRLPSEAEWEYACRAGTTTRYSFGEDPGETLVNTYGWLGANAGAKTHPVGEKPPNPWGLYDIHGNVFEWCADYYGVYPGGQRLGHQKFTVYRGGSWYCPPYDLRSAGRHPSRLVQSHIIGFRLVIGTEADTVLPPLDVAELVPQLAWADDGTSVTVAATTSTEGAEVRYSTTEEEPWPVTSPTLPPVVTKPATVLAIGFKEGMNQSLTLSMVVQQLPPPRLQWNDGAVTITSDVEGVAIEYAITYPDWITYTNPVNLWGARSIKARVRMADWLTSPEVEVNY